MATRLTRRQFVAAAAATASGCASAGPREGHATMDRPNILLIHGDQHRIDCLGAYGNADIRTPHIDSLAGDGVRYDNSFCPYPVCTPSRYSLLSGMYVNEHRGWSNHCTLPPGTDTFPAMLKGVGYRTKAVGKMHFTPTYFDVGFEEMELAEQNGPGRWDDDYHRYLRDRGLVDGSDLEDQERNYRREARPEYWDTFGAMASNLPEEHHSTTWTADRAVDTLENWGAGGNLLMVGFVKPHHPFDPPASWCDRYDPDALTLLPGWMDECPVHDVKMHKGYFPNDTLTEASLRRAMAHYYATIEQIDHHVGRMIDVLKRKGIYDNTMILYTSDHGELLGYHHMLLKGGYIYDALMKVPLVIKYPESAHAGSSTDALVNNIDVAPTILAQAKCAPAPAMHGRDLAAGGDGPEITFCENGRGGQAVARSHTRKLILVPGKNVRLFYDLEKDPCETVNRVDDPAYADDVAHLTQAIEDWRGFDNLSKVYLDEDAPVIDQPNVPSRDDDHRDRMAAYCAEKMKGDWAGD